MSSESFLHAPDGSPIKRVRVSTIARYFWCSPQAWMAALGIINPPNEALTTGTAIHTEIETARKFSDYEKQFIELVGHTYASDGQVALTRTFKDANVEVEIITHGCDGFKVYEDKTVDLIEYKTKGGWRVYPTSLMPAIFQSKLYAWILQPLLDKHGYRWGKVTIVFLKRDRHRKFVPIGESWVEDYNPDEVERKLSVIFDEWKRTCDAKSAKERRNILIPPKSYKCIHCPDCYKNGANQFNLKCPFQDF